MATPAVKMPPGIRSWRDGRVMSDALRKYEIVVIGCSMGGMHAMELVLGALPEDFPLPIAIVQHRYRTSNEGLPAFLRRRTKLKVVDAMDKQWMEPGHVYLAPADYHLLVSPGELHLSVDVLFDSAAEAYGAGVVAVLLTGANADGAKGVKRVKENGGFVVVQDPKSAEAPSMPEAAIAAARVDRILRLERIGPFLVELCRTSR
jgi:two-component system chemotaxis response regulator CheB